MHQEKGKPEYSRWNQCAAIPDDVNSTQARYKLTQALDILKELDMRKSMLAAEVLMSLAKLTKMPDDKFTTMQDKKSALDSQFTFLAEVVNIHELNLGFDHPETADAYSKIAMAYKESGRYAAAAPWMRRSFCVFYKTFGPHDDLTQASYEQLMAIEVTIDSQLHLVAYEELPQVIFQLE